MPKNVVINPFGICFNVTEVICDLSGLFLQTNNSNCNILGGGVVRNVYIHMYLDLASCSCQNIYTLACVKYNSEYPPWPLQKG